MVTRLVRRDHIKLLARIGEERSARFEVDLGKLQAELAEAEEDLQEIGILMALLRRLCDIHSKQGENLDDAGGDGRRLGDTIARTEGPPRRTWTVQVDS